jgi:hypothetical protein
LQDLFHTKLANIRLSATFNRLVRQLALFLLKFKNPLFDRVLNRNFVDYYVGLLRKAMDAVDGLFFNELFEGLVMGSTEVDRNLEG